MRRHVDDAGLLRSTLFTEEMCVSVTRDADGIVCFDYSRCASITLQQVQFANAEHRRLSGQLPTPVLLTGGHIGHVDYRAQRFASGPEVCEITSALAIVVTSFLERHLAKLFLMYHRPPYPVQIFSNPGIAREWLRTFGPASLESST